MERTPLPVRGPDDPQPCGDSQCSYGRMDYTKDPVVFFTEHAPRCRMGKPYDPDEGNGLGTGDLDCDPYCQHCFKHVSTDGDYVWHADEEAERECWEGRFGPVVVAPR